MKKVYGFLGIYEVIIIPRDEPKLTMLFNFKPDKEDIIQLIKDNKVFPILDPNTESYDFSEGSGNRDKYIDGVKKYGLPEFSEKGALFKSVVWYKEGNLGEDIGVTSLKHLRGYVRACD